MSTINSLLSLLTIVTCSGIVNSSPFQFFGEGGREQTNFYPAADTCEKTLQYRRTLECFNQSQILYANDFNCYNFSQQGPCTDGEILVLQPGGRCGEAECIPNPNINVGSSLENCTEDWLNYNGKCISIEEPKGCDGRRGTRVRQTATGENVCECATHLGFVDVGGRCYHEYLQGPCEDGEQLKKTRKGHSCIKNTCPTKGEIRWRDKNCYPVYPQAPSCLDRLMWVDLDLYQQVTPISEELKLMEQFPFLQILEERNLTIFCNNPFDNRITFETCNEHSTEGICLEREEDPLPVPPSARGIQNALCNNDLFKTNVQLLKDQKCPGS